MKYLRNSLAASALFFLLIAAVSPWWVTKVRAHTVPQCSAPNGVTPIAMQNAPPALLQTLKQHVGDIAAPDEEFRATDVVVDELLPNRRIMFIWNTGSRWVVATELGGYGYSNPIFAFELTEDNRRAALVQTITTIEYHTIPDIICSIASDLIRPSRRPPE